MTQPTVARKLVLLLFRGKLLRMDVTAKDVPTAIIHLYRGELGRMTVYRTRLDTTTNWAVATSAGITTFALGQERAPHFVFLLAVFLDLIFLWMEMRRFRFYELIRMRVRLLELGFYALVLGKTPREGWEEAIWKSLESPHAPIGRLAAASVRLRRNYLWLLLAVYLAWYVKLSFGHGSIVENAAVGVLPGGMVIGISTVIIVVLGAIAASHRLSEEE